VQWCERKTSARALRDIGAEVVVRDLLDLDAIHRAIARCETMYFGMSGSDTCLAATVNAAAAAKHHGVKAFINMSQMTLAQMSVTETTPSPQHKLHWLAEQALNWSGLTVVHVRPTVLLEGFLLIFTTDSVRESNQIRLPFGDGETSAVAVEDVARVIAALLADPRPHLGKTYHLTGSRSENMYIYAQEYSEALGRTITYADISVDAWRDGLLERGLPVVPREGSHRFHDSHGSRELWALSGARSTATLEHLPRTRSAFGYFEV
jgi:uncharacterized protein YbjT (DUF2867 family)